MTPDEIEEGFACMRYLIKNQKAILESALCPTWPPRGINDDTRN